MTYTRTQPSAGSGGAPSGPAGGDLSGTFPNPTVPGKATKDLNSRVGGPGGTPLAAYSHSPLISQLDVTKVQAATRASDYLHSIVTYRGGTNSLVEPSIEYVPGGWGSDTNGKAWRYWMVAGPYEGGNVAYENPSLWCSDDGQTWQVPPGVTNPIIPARTADGNNCDPGLFFDDAGRLCFSWCIQNTTSGNDGVWYVSSSDGVTWSAPTKLLSAANANATLSPRTQWDGKLWHLWTLNFTASRIEHRTATTLAGLASATATNCTGLTPPGNDTNLWEFEVKWCGGEWWLLLNGRYGNGNLALASSVDGNAWTQSGTVLGGTNSGSDWDYTVYKSAFVPVFDGDRIVIRLWYNGWSNATTMHVGYTTTYVAGSAALTGSAGGDLSGTFPNPTVAKVNGVAVTGAASSGLVLTATGAAAATWQAAGGGGGGSSGTTPFQAATLGMLSMNVDPSLAQSNLSLTAGVLYLMKVPWLATQTVTNIHAYIAIAGATLTSGQNLAAIYDSTGAKLATTVDQSTAWTATGVKTMALASATSITGSAPGGFVYVALLFNGTTTPQFLRAPNGSIYIGTAAAARMASQLTGQTSMPASLTLSSNTPSGNFPWVGLS